MPPSGASRQQRRHRGEQLGAAAGCVGGSRQPDEDSQHVPDDAWMLPSRHRSSDGCQDQRHSGVPDEMSHNLVPEMSRLAPGGIVHRVRREVYCLPQA